MGENSKIEWTDHTFNPWEGCTKVSEGCKHCYAEALTKRFGRTQWGPTAQRRRTSDSNWRKPLAWNRKAQQEGAPRRVFCASLADIFEDNPQVYDWRYDVYSLTEATPWLNWLLLTKRPENVIDMVPPVWAFRQWPHNVWIGTSVENQAAADKRLPILTCIPAPVRFLSCEPLLGPVDLSPWLRRISWVIAGGESGTQARPMGPDWARSLRDQCQAAGVPFLFKQWGGRNKKAAGRELDGRTWDEIPQ
jgi:protein gp37